jgi:hypothetical protein
VLTPDHFRRRVTRLVSCYAMFKWWLPLSQHPSCSCNPTSFVTEHGLGALDGDLGCFPLDNGTYLPLSNSHEHVLDIRSLPDVSIPLGTIGQTVLYPRGAKFMGLTLKLFRGEPAITKFDKSFAPIHSSSDGFSAPTGSALHLLLRRLQPGHG